jgi:adenine-specific DNA-methyltransferase
MSPAELRTAELHKAHRALFDLERVARFVTDWATRLLSDHVLELSWGEAAFCSPASIGMLRSVPQTGRGSVAGAELHEASARAAERLLRQAGGAIDVQARDFFFMLEGDRLF